MIIRQQALEYFRNNDLIALGMAADQIRGRFHPEGVVSYSMEPAIDAVKVLDFSADEPIEQIVARLEAFKELGSDQVVAVMPRSNGTAVEYLKIVALTRIYLESIPHIQASWQAAGLKLGQVALRFGANDVNGAEAGKLRATEEDFRRIIRDAGFNPKLRDAQFRTYYLN
jgi:2-iminoacetate synthase ThiH